MKLFIMNYYQEVTCVLILLTYTVVTSASSGDTAAAGTSNLMKAMYKVYRMVPANEDQLQFLLHTYEEQAYLDLDFWKAPQRIDKWSDVMVQNVEIDNWLTNELNVRNISYTVIIDDVERLITKRQIEHDNRKLLRARRRRRANSEGDYDFDSYGSYDEMIAYMRQKVKEFPTLASMVAIGEKTYEGNEIYMMKIGNPVANNAKRVVWIDAGIHSREWAAQHTAMFFIDKLLTEYATNATIKRYVDTLNFYIVPVLNPDGYKYTWGTTDPRKRMWRKNRNLQGGRRAGDCFGVDLNRNFDFHWGETGSSTNPCSEIFQGAKPFSEVESRAVRDTLTSPELGCTIRPPGECESEWHSPSCKVDAVITMHTYSQLWIHPYGDRERHYPSDNADLVRVARAATAALTKRFRTPYKFGSGADTLYSASGGSDDWSKCRLGIKYVYLLELRPDENHWDGFILEESALRQTVIETWDGVSVVVEEVLKKNGQSTGANDGTAGRR